MWKDVNQKRSAFSQYWDLHFDPPLPSSPFHHSSSVLFILCLFNVKRVTSLIIPVAFITRSSIESSIYYVRCQIIPKFVIIEQGVRPSQQVHANGKVAGQQESPTLADFFKLMISCLKCEGLSLKSDTYW